MDEGKWERRYRRLRKRHGRVLEEFKGMAYDVLYFTKALTERLEKIEGLAQKKKPQ
jgi:hypothetical protein